MGKKWTSAAIREAAVTDYLKGGSSQQEIGKKYGVGYSTIQRWVNSYYELQKKCNPDFERPKKFWRPAKPNAPEQQEKLPKDVQLLQEELRKARLHNELLQTMIDLAERQLGVDIRKKSGTKRS
jgi:transposase